MEQHPAGGAAAETVRVVAGTPPTTLPPAAAETAAGTDEVEAGVPRLAAGASVVEPELSRGGEGLKYKAS